MKNAWKSSAAELAPPVSLAWITAIISELRVAPSSVGYETLENDANILALYADGEPVEQCHRGYRGCGDPRSNRILC